MDSNSFNLLVSEDRERFAALNLNIRLVENETSRIDLGNGSASRSTPSLVKKRYAPELVAVNEIETILRSSSMRGSIQILVMRREQLQSDRWRLLKWNGESSLDLVKADAQVPRTIHFFYNRHLHDACAFQILLVAPRGVNRNQQMLRTNRIDAGRIGQRLLVSQVGMSLGLCPIGGIELAPLMLSVTELNDFDVIHCLVGGRAVEQDAFKPSLSTENDRLESVEGGKALASASPSELAVVGTAVRLGDTTDSQKFVHYLKQGQHTFGQDQPAIANSAFARASRFDAQFFNLTEYDAEWIDPQEKQLLEVVSEALEDANLSPELIRSKGLRTGVYVAAMWNDFLQEQLRSLGSTEKRAREFSGLHALSDRISQTLDFNGPSVTIDCACVSALAALQSARNDLLLGNCDVAIVASANLVSDESHRKILKELGILSSQTVPKILCDDSDGWLVSEAIAAIVLRRGLDIDLRYQGVHAFIVTCQLGHSGSTKRKGLQDPESNGKELLRLMDEAGYQIDALDYVELGAAGAPLSDYVEVQTIVEAHKGCVRSRPLIIGSVKGNFGHAESCAGLIQLIKVVEQGKLGAIFPTLTHGIPTTLPTIGGLQPVLPRELNWLGRDVKDQLLSLISAGSAGGKRGFTLVRNDAKQTIISDEPIGKLWLFSGRSPDLLLAICLRIIHWLGAPEAKTTHVSNIARSLQVGRNAWNFRAAVYVDENLEGARKRLIALTENLKASMLVPTSRAEATNPLLGFECQHRDISENVNKWLTGEAIDWDSFWEKSCTTVHIPTSAFERSTSALVVESKPELSALKRVDKAIHSLNSGQFSKAVITEFSSFLLDFFSKVLGVPRVFADRETLPMQLGQSSISVSKLCVSLSELAQAVVNPSVFFEGLEIDGISDRLLCRHPQLAKSMPLNDPPGPFNPTATRSTQIEKAGVPWEQSNRIAIIGMSALLPGSNSVEQFWENLRGGLDLVREVPASRWATQDVDHRASKVGAFLEHVDCFDAAFFQIAPSDAKAMDPQERLLLQEAWHTFEDAGIAPDSLRGSRTGVFVGATFCEYPLLEDQHSLKSRSVLGTIANRVSFFFGLNGPSLAVDTICSSSLTALHHARLSLLGGECNLAIVAATNLSLHPRKFEVLAQDGFTSQAGRCQPFSEFADGYVPGEGVVVFLLSRLDKAMENGDKIHALIAGSSATHAGRSMGFTVPRADAQADVIREALKAAQLNPDEISYVETHGTGTALGDPIEAAGIESAFATRSRTKPLIIGSVKSNIGHLEAAAGLAGLLKTVLQVKHKTIVPSLHAQSLNPNIAWAENKIVLSKALTAWDVPTTLGRSQNLVRRAGVSAFGAGGVNAHAIVEEFINESDAESLDTGEGCDQIIVVSAKSDKSLRASALSLLLHLQRYPSLRLPSLAYTLQTGRAHFDHRLAFVSDSVADVIASLEMYCAATICKAIFTSQRNRDTSEVDSNEKEQIARKWADGESFEFRTLWSQRQAVKLSLPGYSFQKDKHWYSDPRPDDVPASCPDPLFNIRSIRTPSHAMQTTMYKDALVAPSSVVNQVNLEFVRIIRRELSLVLECSEVLLGDELALGDLGVTSIHLKQLAATLSTQLDINLSPIDFYVSSSIKAIAATLEAKIRENASVKVSAHSIVTESSTNLMDIAIVGMAGRFPGSSGVEEFWQNLLQCQDMVTEIPASRWDMSEQAEETPELPQRGGFIPNVDTFDPAFFNISPKEASYMDPQQRLFMLVAWEAIENAGYAPSSFSGSPVAVYAGVQGGEYDAMIGWSGDNSRSPFLATGNAKSMIPNRVSYWFNFTGPSELVDTACSSSLIAVNRAVKALRNGECEAALAGGTNLILSAACIMGAHNLGVLSQDGKCKTLDESADGYVKGEGVAIVFLKPLKKAIDDNDLIYAVIKGSATNHGGKAHSLTAPNATSQTEVLCEAYKQSGFNLSDLGYYELHGTGTNLGDPIETQALCAAFEKQQTRDLTPGHKVRQLCYLGSVKSNIGHLEPAAGVVGLIKAALVVNSGIIPGSLHLKKLNPLVKLENTHFRPVFDTVAWPENPLQVDAPRRAAVSSFGFGGANAHIVLEQAPAHSEVRSGSHFSVPVFPLSARDSSALRRQVERLIAFLHHKAQMQHSAAGLSRGSLTLVTLGLIEICSAILHTNKDAVPVDVSLESLGFGRNEFVQLLSLSASSFPGRLHRDDVSLESSLNDLAVIIESREVKSSGHKESSNDPNLNPYFLAQVAYTLQVGRQEFPERLAVVASTEGALVQRLQAWLSGNAIADRSLYCGRVKKGEHGQELVSLSNSPESIARSWVDGASINWGSLYDGHIPGKVRLPTYPFLQNKFWLPKMTAAKWLKQLKAQEADLHNHGTNSPSTQQHSKPLPILVESVSPVSPIGKAYRITVASQNPMLKDHVVGGKIILPGAIMIESVRMAALSLSDKAVSSFKNVAWLHPIEVDQDSCQIVVEFAQKGADLLFTIYESRSPQKICARGTIKFDGNRDRVANESIDIETMKRQATASAKGSDCYQLFSNGGLSYGPAYQVITEIWGNGELLCLANLQTAPDVLDARLELHPCVIDGAFQAAIGFIAQFGDRNDTYLPFSIDSISVFAPIESECFVVVRSLIQTHHKLKRFDLTITNRFGVPLAQIDGYALSLYHRNTSPIQAHSNEIVFIKKRLLEKQPPYHLVQGKTVLILSERTAWLTRLSTTLVGTRVISWLSGDRFEQTARDSYVVNLHSDRDLRSAFACLEGLDSLCVLNLLALDASTQDMSKAFLQALFSFSKAIPKTLDCSMLVLSGNESNLMGRATLGFARCVAFERPKLQIKSLSFDVNDNEVVAGLEPNQLWQEFTEISGGSISIRNTKRLQTFLETERLIFSALPVTTSLPLPKTYLSGAWLISGGLGGLGKTFALCIVEQFNSQVFLIGRSKPDPANQQWLERHGKGKIRYLQGDIAQEASVVNCLNEIRAGGFQIEGLIHSAGVLRDGLIDNKDWKEVSQVLEPKIVGVQLLDKLTAKDPLKHFIVFSSLAGTFGNLGQSDYGFANAYLDAFVERRRECVFQGERHGSSISLMWPYWQNGGMQMPDLTIRAIQKSTGIQPLSDKAGLFAFLTACQRGDGVYSVLQGDSEQIQRLFPALPEQPTDISPNHPDSQRMPFRQSAESATLGSAFKAKLVELVIEILGMKSIDLENDVPLSDYGFDSISFTALCDKLNDALNLNATPAVFFEYQTIAELAAHFSSMPLEASFTTSIAASYDNKISSILPESETIQQSVADLSDDFQDETVRTRVRLERLQAELLTQVAAVLDMDPLSFVPDESLADYGFDSLSYSTLCDRLNELLHLSLSPSLFFEQESVAKLASHLASEYANVLDVRYGTERKLAAKAESRESCEPVKLEHSGSSSAFEVQPSTPFVSVAKAINNVIEPLSITEPTVGLRPLPAEPVLSPPSIPNQSTEQPIAIIGMAGSFPGAANITEYWQNISTGKDSTQKITRPEWRLPESNADIDLEHARPETQWAGFLPDAHRFDADFFGMPANEVPGVDPQQLNFLQTVWQALEDAGIKPSSLQGESVGVFVGVSLVEHTSSGKADLTSAASISGVLTSFIAHRTSQFFNFRGPSEPVDTACSSSISALHRAVRAIQMGDCEIAVVGGVNSLLSPFYHRAVGNTGLLSPSGRCRPFSNDANGYVRGEGVGVVILKKLGIGAQTPLRARALIRHVSVNHSGRSLTPTTPNPAAFSRIISSTLENAKIDPRTIGYFETHGSSSVIGDAAEFTAMCKVFQKYTENDVSSSPLDAWCAIGAVKANVGHLESASGIASLIKTVMVLEKGVIPPIILGDGLNRYLPKGPLPFYFPVESEIWPKVKTHDLPMFPRRAAISCFGLGGANGHLILEGAPTEPIQPLDVGNHKRLVVLSARTQAQLFARLQSLEKWFSDLEVEHTESSRVLDSICATLQLGRDEFDHRIAFVVDSLAELGAVLKDLPHSIEKLLASSANTAIMFSGLELPKALRDGSMGEVVVDYSLKTNDLSTLGQLWCCGMNVAWERLYTNRVPPTIRLPGYPFHVIGDTPCATADA
jgi:acyl transferase domain-containing protein/acyl carrier protein